MKIPTSPIPSLVLLVLALCAGNMTPIVLIVWIDQPGKITTDKVMSDRGRPGDQI